MSYYNNEEIGCFVYVIVTILGIIVIIWSMWGDKKDGVLYMLGSDQPVCEGTIHITHHESGSDATFYCSDGRVIKHVTNYIFKEVK